MLVKLVKQVKKSCTCGERDFGLACPANRGSVVRESSLVWQPRVTGTDVGHRHQRVLTTGLDNEARAFHSRPSRAHSKADSKNRRGAVTSTEHLFFLLVHQPSSRSPTNS